MLFAQILAKTIEGYLVLGFVFALAFVLFGVTRLDESARGTGVFFRFLIFFGAVAVWPLLAWRWVNGRGRPTEVNAHRLETTS